MRQRVALVGAVALAIRQVFQDRRHRGLDRVLGQPNASSEPCSVGQRDHRVLDLVHAVRKRIGHAVGVPGLEGRQGVYGAEVGGGNVTGSGVSGTLHAP